MSGPTKCPVILTRDHAAFTIGGFTNDQSEGEVKRGPHELMSGPTKIPATLLTLTTQPLLACSVGSAALNATNTVSTCSAGHVQLSDVTLA